MIVKNTGTKRLMIVTEWTADRFGGPASMETTYAVMPGDMIDLRLLGLEPVYEDESEITKWFCEDCNSFFPSKEELKTHLSSLRYL